MGSSPILLQGLICPSIEAQENVILSAAARRSSLARRSGGGRRILSRRSDPSGRSAHCDPWVTLLTAKCGAAAATGPSVAARLFGSRGLRPAATLRMTFQGIGRPGGFLGSGSAVAVALGAVAQRLERLHVVAPDGLE